MKLNNITFNGSEIIAIANVNVIPMDNERVLEDQTVLIENGIVSKIGKFGELIIPDGAKTINGDNGYLMPGLADMHMHIKKHKGPYDTRQLLEYLAQGSTTIRSLGTAPKAYGLRAELAKGNLIGPSFYTMGRTFTGNYRNQNGVGLPLFLFNLLRLLTPLIAGTFLYLSFDQYRDPQIVLVAAPILLLIGLLLLLTKTPPFNILAPLFDVQHVFFVENCRQAKAELTRQQNWKVDGIKVYDGLPEKHYLEIIEEAKRRSMYVSGHILNQTNLNVQFTSGIDEIAHIDEFLSSHWIGNNFGENSDPLYSKSFDYPLDYESIDKTASMTANNNIAVISNLSADEAFANLILDTDGTLDRLEYRLGFPQFVQAWRTKGRHKTVFYPYW